MTEKNCLNCQTVIEVGQKFCSQCGQKVGIHRFTIIHIIHEFVHAFTHTDKGIFSLLRQLALQPGVVISEYVDGKRKKYFNPFTFFLLVMGFFVFMNTYFSPYGKPPEPNPKILERIPNEKGRQMYISSVKRSARVNNITQKNGNILAMIALPLFSFICWLFFRKRKRNYAEILVANVFLIAFANLVFTLTITPLLAATVGKPVFYYILAGGLLLQAVYFGWGMFQFLQMKYRWEIIKTTAVNIVGVVIWSIITGFAAFWYITGDNFSLIARSIIQKYFS